MRPVFTLTLTLAVMSFATLASASSKPAPQKASPRAPEAPVVTSARDAIDRELIAPLAEKDEGQSRYSRAMVPPHDRTVRILDAQPRADSSGKSFLAFAVDEGRGGNTLRKDAITGCVYPGTGTVFIQRDGSFFPASLLLGKNASAAAGVCKADDAASKRPTGWFAALRAKL